MKNLKLWLPAALLVTALTWALNLESAWWSDPPRWYNILITLVYIIFWVAFTHAARGDRKAGLFLLTAALLHLFSALCSMGTRLVVRHILPVAFFDSFCIVGALFSPFPAAVVFHGLALLTGRDWALFYALTSLLTAAWTLWLVRLLGRTAPVKRDASAGSWEAEGTARE